MPAARSSRLPYRAVWQVAVGATQLTTKLSDICLNLQISAEPEMVLNNVSFASPCDVRINGSIDLYTAELETMINEGKLTYHYPDETSLTLTATMLYYFIMAEVRSERNKANWKYTITVLSALLSGDPRAVQEGVKAVLDVACPDGHLYNGYCGSDKYEGGFGANYAIIALDYINRFTVDSSMGLCHGLKQSYNGFAVFTANQDGIGILGWPALATPATYGWRQNVRALVVANLFDGATPMGNSKWMREGFVGGSLITWQGVGHCTIEADCAHAQREPRGLFACAQMFVLSAVDRIELPPSCAFRRPTGYPCVPP